MSIAMFATNVATMRLMNAIKRELETQKRSAEVIFSPVPDAAPFRDEYPRATFALVAVLGEERHMLAGFDTLQRAVRIGVPAGIMVDQAGHDYCFARRNEYLGCERIRCSVLIGEGAFERESGLRHPMGRPERVPLTWNDDHVRRLTERLVAVSKKQLCF